MPHSVETAARQADAEVVRESFQEAFRRAVLRAAELRAAEKLAEAIAELERIARLAPPDSDEHARLQEVIAESRLEVLASDDDPRIWTALDRNDYHRLIQLLDRFYNLIVLDTGTGILDSANQGLLTEADQIVPTIPNERNPLRFVVIRSTTTLRTNAIESAGSRCERPLRM